MKKNIAVWKRYAIAFFCLWIILLGFKIVSCYLPNERISNHMAISSDLILKEGRYPQNFINLPVQGFDYLYASVRIDTVQDYSVLSTAFLNNSQNAVKNALLNTGIYITEPENIVRMFRGEPEETMDRPQYWMGLTAILRVLYYFFDMAAVRQFSLLVFTLISVYLLICIAKEFGTSYAVALAVSMVCVNVWILPFTPVLNITYYLAVLFSIVILKLYGKNPVALWMFCFGIITAFFDWMSTPLLTYGLPMVMILLILMKKSNELKLKNGIFLLFKNGIAWIAGYSMMIISKWVIGTLLLGINVFEIGLKRADAGMNVLVEGDAPTALGVAKQSLEYNFYALYPFTSQPTKVKWGILLGILLIMAVMLAIFHKKFSQCIPSVLLLFVGAIPYAWYIVLKGHCHIHFWFTYRSQMISIMALCCALIYALDIEKIRKLCSSLFHSESLNEG